MVEFSFGNLAIWLCEFIAEIVLFLLLSYTAYVWARPVRWLIGATAFVDVVKFAIHHDISAYAHLWGFWRIVEVCWLAWLAGYFVGLLVPRMQDSVRLRIPYALVLTAAIVTGPPQVMTDFYQFQRFGLVVAILTACYGIFTSVLDRFEDMALALGLLACSQGIAGEVMVRVGYAPKVAQIGWIIGLVLVAHTLVVYQPPCLSWPLVRAETAS